MDSLTAALATGQLVLEALKDMLFFLAGLAVGVAKHRHCGRLPWRHRGEAS
jgi:hypothetical protein